VRWLLFFLVSFLSFAITQEGEYGFRGQVNTNTEIIGIIGANLDGDYTHHSYSFTAPEGIGMLEINLESQQGQLGLAVQRGQNFTTISNADSFESQERKQQSYSLKNLMPNTIYNIVIVNESKRVHRYTLTVEELESPQASLSTAALESTKIGVLTPNLVIAGLIDRSEDAEFASYHTYIVDVPEGSTLLKLSLSSDFDLDMAVKYGRDLQSYATKEEGGDWLEADFSEAKGATLTFTNPQAGFWYLDVIHSSAGERPYTISAQID